MRVLSLLAAVGLLVLLLAALGAGPARAVEAPMFGIEPGGFTSSFAEPPFASGPLGEFFDDGGTVVTQAGAHPYAVTFTVVFNHIVEKEEVVDPGGTPEEKVPTQVLTGSDPKNVAVNLPAGMVADPRATPTRCEEASLEADSCPASSAVGLIAAYVDGFPFRAIGPLYNMVAPAGVLAQFGANPGGLGIVLHVDGKLRTGSGLEGGYAVSAEVTNILDTYPVYAVAITLWGDPSDSAHNAERGSCGEQPPSSKAGGQGVSCPLEPDETSETAFLTMPTSCPGESLVSSIAVESWKEPGVPFLAKSSAPALTDCDALEFKPAIEVGGVGVVGTETSAADTPTGLRVDLHVPQNEQVGEIATANLKNAVIALPEGMTIDPSSADGLTSCPLLKGIEPEKEAREQKGEEKGINLESSEPANCPNASKIGTVEVRTPLFENPLPGSVYLAKPYENPFPSEGHPGGSLLAIYIVVEDPVTGVVIKLAGHVEANSETGQLTMSIQELPQLPIEDLKLDFFGGPRGLLVTPPACGTATSTANLTPWSSEEVATPSSGFEIDKGCVHGFAPTLLAGGLNVLAGAYSPFTLTFSRQDSEQTLGSFSLTTPPGLLANLSGVPLCAEPQAARGECGPASEIGTARIAAGAGSNPIYLGGHIYLTGPTLPAEGPNHSGEPFGLSIVVPADAGPFDLGIITIRASVAVNPQTAALTIASDSLPQIIDGIPLDIKQIKVAIDRAGFMFNPTSCQPSSVTATIASTAGTSAAVSSRFQVASCASEPFSPKLTALTLANGEFQGHGASLHIVIASPAGQANLRSLKVDLPQRLPARLGAIQDACSESTFDANPAACPQASVVGSASVATSILDTPMTGPAYLVSKSGTTATHAGESKTAREEVAFPDMVLLLQGQGVRIDLTGALFVSEKNVTSVAFRSIPDVPIRRLDLVLPEGNSSILAASSGLCTKKPLTMFTAITGQNGARVKPLVKVAVEGCKHKKPKRPKPRQKPKRHRT